MEKLLLIFTLLFVTNTSFASDTQSAPEGSSPSSQTELYNEILRMDTLFFDAFNRRELKTTSSLFAKDLEFYHDKGGFSDYQKNLENSKSMFANNKTLQRELIRESLQVYPIKDYGALQIGEHRFCSLNNGKQDCAIFKFTHIWRKVGEGWQLARVISYDH
ncbi:nuclear transport factor 2 family protein [Cellvibrio fibrivorans]|uniref:Ketosteroid isomerase-like protein n=1 Tax=Cellvibrio fibrivorans TaxID=126350 RepID=A0ABU1V415_9GAMM|nr:nuclear transport factor 2 family protein [Cellvibrio fibrivorans]MDR7092164.1 ketosteroid isomerase-like protein [Cellvibrio fibrivorans]